MGRCDARFRRENPGGSSPQQVSADLPSGCERDCALGSDQFAHPNAVEAHLTRRLAEKWIVVIAPRLSSRVGFPPIGELWKETLIEFPETLSLEDAHDLFTCHPIPLRDRQANLADALSVLPFAAITNL